MAERKLKTRDVNERGVRKLFDTTIKVPRFTKEFTQSKEVIARLIRSSSALSYIQTSLL